MNWESVLQITLTSAITGLAYYFLEEGTKKKVHKIDGIYKLELPPIYKWMGYIMFAINIFFVVFSIIEFEFNIVGLIVNFGLLFPLGLICWLNYKNHKLYFGKKRIKVSTWNKKIKTIRWEDISRAKFNPMSGYLILHDKHSKKIKISSHFVGLRKFIEMLESKTKWTAQSIKFPMN